MKRKTASFSQLLHYMNKGRVENDEYSFKHNVYGIKPRSIVNEYMENCRFQKKRKNGNLLYHEIFSIKYQDGYSKEKLREILIDASREYVNARAGNCLVYGVVHEQHNQIHMHLMISSNEIASTKPSYFSKSDFKKIIELTRDYTYNKYPRLERDEKTKDKTNKKPRAKTRTIDNEYQLKKRTGKKSDREIMRERLQGIFAKSPNSESFIQALQDEKIKVYERGKTFGFTDETTGKKYRLKTLELEEEFKEMLEVFLQAIQNHIDQTKNHFTSKVHNVMTENVVSQVEAQTKKKTNDHITEATINYQKEMINRTLREREDRLDKELKPERDIQKAKDITREELYKTLRQKEKDKEKEKSKEHVFTK